MNIPWKRVIIWSMFTVGLILVATWLLATVMPHWVDMTVPSPASAITNSDTQVSDTTACFNDVCPMTPEELAAMGQMMAPFFGWIGHNWMLLVGLPLLFISCIRLYVRRRKNRPSVANPTETVIAGKTVKLPTLTCRQAKLILPGDPRFAGLSFDKIIGQAEAKADITEVLEFLQHPEKFKKMEADLPVGVLLYGASGTGKTLLVRTLAAICNLPVLQLVGSEFVEKYVGVGSTRVAQLYADADALVKIYGACLIFIDEFDAVGRKRDGGANGNSESETTLDQLLGEMDGMIPRPRVLTFGATNRKDILDPDILRRFERQIEFFNPNKHDREGILELYLPEHLRADDVVFVRAARVTASASGAHLKTIVNEAKIAAARQNLDKVTASILDEAVQKVLHGARRDAQRTVLNEAEIDTVKVHEGGHAFVYFKRSGRAPLRFTIIPRGQSGGHVEFDEDFELLRTREHLETRLVVAMGGWAGTFVERAGQEDTGAAMDYQMATKLAVEMVTVYGMSPLGPLNLQALAEANLVSDEFKARVVAEVEKKVNWAKTEALRIVSEDRAGLRLLINAIDEHETLLEAEFEALFMKPGDGTGKVVPFERPVTPPVFATPSQDRRAAITIRVPVPALLRNLRWGKRKMEVTSPGN